MKTLHLNQFTLAFKAVFTGYANNYQKTFVFCVLFSFLMILAIVANHFLHIKFMTY